MTAGGLLDGDHLGVSHRAAAQLAFVAGRGDHLAAQHDDRADGHVAVPSGLFRLPQRQPHVVVVPREVLVAHGRIMPD